MEKVFCGTSGTDVTPETHKLSSLSIEPGVAQSLQDYYGHDFTLRPAQEAALFQQSILSKTDNAIIATPTNSGKSLISYLLLLQSAFNGKNAVLVEPLRALAYEKSIELSKITDIIKEKTKVKIKVVVTTGDYRLTDETMFSKPEREKGNLGRIIIATPERLDAISRMPQNKEWFNSIAVVIFDEAHLMGDAHRGPTIELLITFLSLLSTKPRLILMSATISNAQEIANWLSPCEIIENVQRYPSLSKWAYILEDKEKADDILLYETQEILKSNNTSIIIFVYQTASAELLAKKIAEKLYGKKLNKKDLSYIMSCGVAWFHSQLSASTKERIIEEMTCGNVRIVVSTTALAMGINLPATHVFIRDITFSGYKDLDVSDLLQMLGRAGRGNINGTGAVFISGANISKKETIIAGLKNEVVPSISSQMTMSEREGYFGSVTPSIQYIDQASSQLMGILNRTGSTTTKHLEQYIAHTFAGKHFNDLDLLLRQLVRWKLAYQDENTNEYQLTRLGIIGCTSYMPPSVVANSGQFIRDLLSDDHSGMHLVKLTTIDFIIILCLVSDEMRPICRYNKSLEEKIDQYMESLPLQEKSYLYQKWIKGDPESLIGSARISQVHKDARKVVTLATFTAMFLYDISRGYQVPLLDKYYAVNSEEIQEKYRDNVLWLLFGLEKMMEVRCFYYHLKENCCASIEQVASVDKAFRLCSNKIFSLVGNLKYRSVLGEMIRGIKRIYKSANSYPAEGTIRKLENAGILSLRDLVGKKSQDLVAIGIKKDYADLIVGYIRKRSQ